LNCCTCFHRLLACRRRRLTDYYLKPRVGKLRGCLSALPFISNIKTRNSIRVRYIEEKGKRSSRIGIFPSENKLEGRLSVHATLNTHNIISYAAPPPHHRTFDPSYQYGGRNPAKFDAIELSPLSSFFLCPVNSNCTCRWICTSQST